MNLREAPTPMGVARLGFLAAFCIAMLGAPSPRPKNLALQRPYTLSPAPNYSLTTDPGDAVQLTDGVSSGGGFWTEKRTVGWSRLSPVRIVVDLGHDAPIAG